MTFTPEDALAIAERAFKDSWVRTPKANIYRLEVYDGRCSMPWPSSRNTIRRNARELAERGRRFGAENCVPGPDDRGEEHKQTRMLASEHLRAFWWFDTGTGQNTLGLRAWMR